MPNLVSLQMISSALALSSKPLTNPEVPFILISVKLKADCNRPFKADSKNILVQENNKWQRAMLKNESSVITKKTKYRNQRYLS